MTILKLTIAKAAERILHEKKEPLELKTIYDEIKKNNLYEFKENVDELHILRNQIERKCLNSNFAYTTEAKIFVRDKNKYALIEWYTEEGLKKFFENDDITVLDLKSQIDKLTKSFNVLETKLDNVGQVEKIYEKVQEQEFTFKNKINTFEQESKDSLTTFNTNKDEYINEIKTYKKDIRKILEKVTSYELSNLYSAKVEELKGKLLIYHIGFLLLLVISFLVGFYLFIGYSFPFMHTPENIIKILNNENNWVKIGSKFILIFPIVVIATFYWNRYNKTNKLLEEYDYKVMLSKTFISNFNMIVEQTKAETDNAHVKSIHLALERLLETPNIDTYKNTKENNSIDINMLKELSNMLSKGKE